MAVVPIKIVPDKVLNKKCQKVKKFDKETKDLAKDLMDTLLDAKDPEGAGLAAPQIGILKRMCIVRDFLPDPVDPKNTISQELLLINPRIISKSNEIELDWEGCLSIPDTYGKVERSKKIKLKAQDVDGNDIKMNTTGFLARVIQHEIDHLDGILFTSKIVGQTLTEEEIDKLEKLEESSTFVG
jgi:peptide deformylase